MNYASFEDVKNIVTGMAKKIPHGIMQGNVPIGTIISYMGTTPPVDYLACDGTVYQISNYTELAEFIKTEFGSYNYFGGDGTTTFAVPDLRGEFLRGAGTNSHSEQGSGSTVGTHQDATKIPSVYPWTENSSSSNANIIAELLPDKTANFANFVDYALVGSSTRAYVAIGGTKVSLTTGSTYKYTTRPTNTSVLYCIKYKKSSTVWETIDIGRFVATSPVYYERAELPTPNKTTITIHNTWVNINNVGYVLENDKVLDLTNSDSWDDAIYTTASNRAGKDFYIYVCEPVSDVAPKFILSANSTVPTGYTADNSRKIGGFHCLCLSVGTISGHTLSGYLTGDILPLSVYDLKHRSKSENEGMVYIPPIGMWGDIYLGSWNGSNLVSKFNGVCVIGTSAKAMHGLMMAEEYGLVNKHLPSYDDFIVFAKGTPEGSHISTDALPAGAGGHVDKSSRRIISNYGLEDCCGVLWQWSKDTVEYTPGSTWNSNNYWLDGLSWQDKPVYNSTVDTIKRGSSNGLLRRLVVGASYAYAVAYCGSRAVSCIYFGALLSVVIGGRGFAEER